MTELPRDNLGERTEEPTPQQMQRARQRGRVPRSADLAAALLLVSGSVLVAALAPALLRSLLEMVRALLGGAGAADPGALGVDVLAAAGPVIRTAAVLLAGLCAIAILAGVVQVGLRARMANCRLDFGRLRPAGRMLSRRGCVRAAMAIGKLAAVGAVTAVTIRTRLPEIAALPAMRPSGIAAAAGRLLAVLVVRIGIVLLAVAILDYLYQRSEHRRELKMTRREWQEDLKETTPDPGVRRRHRTLVQRGPVPRI